MLYVKKSGFTIFELWMQIEWSYYSIYNIRIFIVRTRAVSYDVAYVVRLLSITKWLSYSKGLLEVGPLKFIDHIYSPSAHFIFTVYLQLIHNGIINTLSLNILFVWNIIASPTSILMLHTWISNKRRISLQLKMGLCCIIKDTHPFFWEDQLIWTPLLYLLSLPWMIIFMLAIS